MNPSPTQRSARRTLINTFLLVHLVLLLLWTWPRATERWLPLRVAAPYLRATGLAQLWNMFAWPRTFNFHVEVAITFQDGSVRHIQLPWDERETLLNRYRRSRFLLKWLDAVGLANIKPFPRLWQDAARFFARHYATAINPPTIVSLTCVWADIPPPPEGLGKPLPPHTRRHAYYTYTVTPEDLR